jgi:hypothetical protein
MAPAKSTAHAVRAAVLDFIPPFPLDPLRQSHLVREVPHPQDVFNVSAVNFSRIPFLGYSMLGRR